MAPRILFLDDDRIRHDTFAKRFANAECVHVETFDEFERALLRGTRFDAISLDHDLNDFGQRSVIDMSGMYGSTERSELTGTDAAVLVSRLPEDKRPDVVVIHSWNAPGAERMRAILADAGLSVVVQPFKADKK